MINALKNQARGPEILTFLKEQGPLSFSAIFQLLQPPMQKKRLHRTLARLIKNGVLSRRNEKMFGGRGTFYQLKQSPLSRKVISKIINCEPDDLLQPYFRYREINHNGSTALVANCLKLHYPEAEVVRDFQFSTHEAVEKIIKKAKKDYEMRPDILALFPRRESGVKTTIAFEIERSRKSDKRLTFKLTKLANSLVDGVVYLCESEKIIRALRMNFKTRVLDKTARINHYSDHFIVFSDLNSKQKFSDTLLYSLTGKSFRMTDWINYLRTNTRPNRNDSAASQGGLLSSLEKN